MKPMMRPAAKLAVAMMAVMACGLGAVSGAGAQQACRAGQAGITIYGAVPARHFSPEDLNALPQVQYLGVDHGGAPTRYEGVPLGTLLALAGTAVNNGLRGAAMRSTLRIEARDGYAAALAIAEVDTSFRAHVPLVALRANGVPLDTANGPLQLVVPDDMRHARWVRQLACVRVMSDNTK